MPCPRLKLTARAFRGPLLKLCPQETIPVHIPWSEWGARDRWWDGCRQRLVNRTSPHYITFLSQNAETSKNSGLPGYYENISKPEDSFFFPKVLFKILTSKKKKNSDFRNAWWSRVKNPPCNIGDAGLTPGQGTKTPQAAEQLGPQAPATEPEHS